MPHLSLPDIITRYFAADAARDVDALIACFTEEATVHDEKHDHHGHADIRRWKQATIAKYRYTIEPLSAEAEGAPVFVHTRLTGNFPGSPVELDFVFTLKSGMITRLVIE